jgi:hypothetical protein
VEATIVTRNSTAVCVLLLSAIGARESFSEELQPTTVEKSPGGVPVVVDEPMSIFNHEVRRFCFAIEDLPVTVETAEEFMLLHQPRNEPEIIGALADSESNSLIVIGPPEAELPIRVTLAKWLVERQGAVSPLNLQKRTLEFRRKELLCAMAGVEIQLVEAMSEKETQLRARLQAVEDELSIVEKQLQVVERYLLRIRDVVSDPRQTAAAR